MISTTFLVIANFLFTNLLSTNADPLLVGYSDNRVSTYTSLNIHTLLTYNTKPQTKWYFTLPQAQDEEWNYTNCTMKYGQAQYILNCSFNKSIITLELPKFGFLAQPALDISNEFFEKFIRNQDDWVRNYKNQYPQQNQYLENQHAHFEVCCQKNPTLPKTVLSNFRLQTEDQIFWQNQTQMTYLPVTSKDSNITFGYANETYQNFTLQLFTTNIILKGSLLLLKIHTKDLQNQLIEFNATLQYESNKKLLSQTLNYNQIFFNLSNETMNCSGEIEIQVQKSLNSTQIIGFSYEVAVLQQKVINTYERSDILKEKVYYSFYIIIIRWFWSEDSDSDSNSDHAYDLTSLHKLMVAALFLLSFELMIEITRAVNYVIKHKTLLKCKPFKVRNIVCCIRRPCIERLKHFIRREDYQNPVDNSYRA